MNKRIALALTLAGLVLIADRAISQVTNTLPSFSGSCTPTATAPCVWTVALVSTAAGTTREVTIAQNVTVPIPTVQTSIPGSGPCSSFATAANPLPLLADLSPSTAPAPHNCIRVGVYDSSTGGLAMRIEGDPRVDGKECAGWNVKLHPCLYERTSFPAIHSSALTPFPVPMPRPWHGPYF